MNILKHMEAAFIFTLSVAGVASVVADTIPAAQAHVMPAMAPVAAPAALSTIPVVHVTAKRMTAAEKQRSLAEEARGSRA